MSYASRNSLCFGFLVLVVVTVGGYWTGIRQIRRLEELKSEETRYTTELQSISALLADYDALRVDLDGLKARWRGRKQVVPASDTPAGTLTYIDEIRDRAGSGISYGFQFKGRKDADGYSTNCYALTGKARFANLYHFIRMLERGERFYTVDQLEIVHRDPEIRKPGWTWVNFKILFRAYFEPGSRIEDLVPSVARLAANDRLPNPFHPHITRTLPENTDGLFDVGGARLTALSKEIAYLVDLKGRSAFLRRGDLVFMGRLKEIDLERSRVVFELNKGGVWERLVINVEIANGHS